MNDLLKELRSVEEKIKGFVQDKSHPLDERWYLFVESGLGVQEYYGPSFKALPNDIVMCDGLVHADRYQTIYTKDIVDGYSESNRKDEWHSMGFDLNKFKEEVLEKFQRSFEYDW